MAATTVPLMRAKNIFDSTDFPKGLKPRFHFVDLSARLKPCPFKATSCMNNYYTILNALPTTICRSRVKVSGVVMPSPVGVAML